MFIILLEKRSITARRSTTVYVTLSIYLSEDISSNKMKLEGLQPRSQCCMKSSPVTAPPEVSPLKEFFLPLLTRILYCIPTMDRWIRNRWKARSAIATATISLFRKGTQLLPGSARGEGEGNARGARTERFIRGTFDDERREIRPMNHCASLSLFTL